MCILLQLFKSLKSKYPQLIIYFIGLRPFMGIKYNLAKLILWNSITSPVKHPTTSQCLEHSKALINAYNAKLCEETLELGSNILWMTRACTGHLQALVHVQLEAKRGKELIGLNWMGSATKQLDTTMPKLFFSGHAIHTLRHI